MDKNKEILEIKKLYLAQVERWESRTFFSSVAFSLSLILLAFQGIISYWWGIGLYLFTSIPLEIFIEYWRTKKFNELKKEIEKEKFEAISLG